MLAPLLALLSSISWGTADFLGGLKSRKLPLLTVLVATQVTGFLVVGTFMLLARTAPPASDLVIYAGLSSVAGLIGIAAFFRALSVGTMSVVAPISATAAVIPVAVGVATGESLTGLQAGGIGLALAGVVLAAREAEAESVQSGRLVAGAGMAVVAALGFGCFFLGMNAASADSLSWAVFVNRCVSLALTVLIAVALRSPPRFERGDIPGLVAIDLLTLTGITLFAAASNRGLLSLVSVIGSLYPVTTILLAHTVLHERIHRAQKVGVVAALAGVGLISAG